ncbi:tetratricopeptide repeat protein [bacterium]|nr:tetratricopeptide repeat protein [bacterium]
MTRYLSISAALIAAMLALAACDRASTATSDPGDILERRATGLPAVHDFRPWERGPDVADGIRRVLTADPAPCDDLKTLATADVPALLRLAAEIRAREEKCESGAIDAPERPILFSSPDGTAPRLAVDLSDVSLALFNPMHPEILATPEDQTSVTGGFGAIEKVDDLSDSDSAALSEEGAVAARLVGPEGYDLVIFPDGFLAGRDAPKGGPWRLATGQFAEPARLLFAKSMLRRADELGPLAAILAIDSGQGGEALEWLEKFTDTGAADSAEGRRMRARALMVRHEMLWHGERAQSVKLLRRLVLTYPEDKYVRAIGFYRLIWYYAQTYSWRDYYDIYQKVGDKVIPHPSAAQTERLAMIKDVLKAEADRKRGMVLSADRLRQVTESYDELGDFDSALRLFADAIDRAEKGSEEYWSMQLARARLLIKTGAYDEAEALLKDMVDDGESILVRSGRVYRVYGDLYKAQALDDKLLWAEQQYKKAFETFRPREGEKLPPPF